VLVRNYPIAGKKASEIVATIEEGIRGGRLRAGERLPAVRALAAELGLSPGTVAAAYATLKSRGLLTARGRQGSRVSFRPPLAAPGPRPAHTPRARSRPASDARTRARLRRLDDGNPDPRLLPPLRPVLHRVSGRQRLYGEPQNVAELVSLARRQLSSERIAAEHLTVVGGALDGIERSLAAHLRPGDRVAVEDPGFPGVLDLVGALGLVAEPVRVDDDGPRPEDLQAALERHAQALIVTPRAQNPTGAAFAEARVTELRRVLRAFPEALLIEDDHAGPVAGAPARTLSERGRRRWAVVRSVSKSLGPDLRLAILAGDATTVARVEGRRLVGSGWVSSILQHAVALLWSDPATGDRLRHAAEIYAGRRRALITALARYGIEAHGRSGMNVWIPVREESELVERLREAGWAVLGGERFRLLSASALRVTVSRLEAQDADRFAGDLAGALEAQRLTRRP
jgi:DNA-binding transcriptional MocR family regulator